MLIPALTLSYFYILHLIWKIKTLRYDSSIQLIAIFFSIVLLQLLRIHGQNLFPDIPNYNLIFRDIKPMSFVLENGYGLEYYEENENFTALLTVPIEIGFSIFISVFKVFSNNFYYFLFLISALQLTTFYIFCKKCKLNIVTSLMVYIGLTYVTFQIGMLRQSLAFCFFLLAIIYGRNKLFFIFFILIGFTFHRSILFCLIFFFSTVYFNRKFVLFVSVVSLILYLFEIDVISQLFSSISSIEDIEYNKINFYLNVDRSNNYLGIGFWERLILLILINYVYQDLVKRGLMNPFRNLFFNLSFFLIILQLVFFASPTITSRLRYYIVIFPIIFLFEYIKLLKNNCLKLSFELLIFLYLMLQLNFLSTYLMNNKIV